jgi:fumarylpyruvate hydrolase
MEPTMTDYVLPPPPVPSVAVSGTAARFPVRRIICVGRNYAAHAREMGRDPDREPPFFFLKPADTVVDDGATVPYPPETENFHYEIELIVAIGTAGTDIPVESALDHVFGYGVGIDLTRRDLQLAAREQGRPWDWGKGFDLSAPIAPLHPRLRGGPSHCRPHLDRGGWAGEAGLRHRQADLAGAGHHLDRFPLDGAAPR